mgnify:CR=1 FL=1
MPLKEDNKATIMLVSQVEAPEMDDITKPAPGVGETASRKGLQTSHQREIFCVSKISKLSTKGNLLKTYKTPENDSQTFGAAKSKQFKKTLCLPRTDRVVPADAYPRIEQHSWLLCQIRQQ